MSDSVITAEGLSKKFVIGRQGQQDALLRELFDRHLNSLEAVGNVGVDHLDGLNTTLKRLERFWIDQVRFRL